MGNLLGSPITEKETHTGITPCNVQYGVSSMQGWRVHMEDAHICEPHLYAMDGDTKIDLPDHSLFAVFDGHGGSFAATYSSKNLLRVLSCQPKFVQYGKFVRERAQKEASITVPAERSKYIRSGLDLLEGALRDAFVEIDREIFQSLEGNEHPQANTPYQQKSGFKEDGKANPTDQQIDGTNTANAEEHPDEDSGTTAVVVVVTPQWVVCANAGDSRAVFSKGGHKAVPLSYDHKPDDEEEERRIRNAGGYVAGGRVEGDLAVSRGLGDYRFKVPRVVLSGTSRTGSAADDNNNKNSSTEKIMFPDEQKVSPVPDIIVQNRNSEHDEFIIIACDGIWDVQTNYEGVRSVASIFAEGESDLGLVCEEILDLCLSIGSKDNMTAMILKFDAEKIGEGGGVMARRQLRDAAANETKVEAEEASMENS